MTMDISNSAIGIRIREIRKIKGLTLEQLAECAEISANFLWEIEQGRKCMIVQNLAKLAAALDVSADYLLFGIRENASDGKLNIMMSVLPDELKDNFEKMAELFIDTVRCCRAKVTNEENSTEKE